MRKQDWNSAHALLDEVRDNATTKDEMKDEVYWRARALGRAHRYDEALELLRNSASLFNSQCLVHQQRARMLLKLGRDREALDELREAPIEEEMADHYGLAIDAKFFYLYLLAKSGDPSVRVRLSEIPDDYRHITMDGKLLTKADIAAFLR